LEALFPITTFCYLSTYENNSINQELFKAHPFMKKASPLTDEQYSLLTKRLRAAAPENRITCSGAIAIAKTLGVPCGEIGRIADKLNIRISKCQLGCF
jgi:hypothetical protein